LFSQQQAVHWCAKFHERYAWFQHNRHGFLAQVISSGPLAYPGLENANGAIFFHLPCSTKTRQLPQTSFYFDMSAQRNHFELLAGLSEKKAGTPANSAAAKTKNAEKKKKQREKKKAQKIASAPAPPVVMAEEVEYEVVRVDGEVFKFPKSKPSQNTQPVVSVAVEPTEENEQGEGSDGDVDLPPPRVGRSIPITFGSYLILTKLGIRCGSLLVDSIGSQ
jgi:hypothetical protein